MQIFKKAKSALTLVFAVLFLFSFLSVFVSAEEGKTITATTSASLMQGSSTSCSVYIDSTESLSALDVAVYFDSAKIKVTGVTNSVSCTLYDSAIHTDHVQLSYIFDGKGTASKTRLFYFSYQVLSGAELGDTYFDITIGEAYDSALNDVAVSGSRCTLNVTKYVPSKSCSVSSQSTVDTSVENEFSLSYRFSTYQIASGSAVITYDPEIFQVVSVENGAFLTGKIADVNAALSGSVYISFVGTEYGTKYDFVTVTFKTLKNVTETSPITFKATELCDKDLNAISCKDFVTTANIAFNDSYVEDAPAMTVSAFFDEAQNKLFADIFLEKDSKLGAGDFVLSFDPSLLTLSSYEKGFSPSFFNINEKEISDGKLKFSIVSLEDIVDEQKVLSLVFDVNPSCYPETVLSLQGSMISDSLTNPIPMNLIGTSVSLPTPHVFDNACDSVCNTEDCGFIRQVGDHVFDNACDTECGECGYVRSVPDHIYENSCDTACNECGFKREAIHTPANGVCTQCGEKAVRPISAQLVLDKYIGVKFYFNKSEVDENFTFRVTLPGRDTPLAEGSFSDLKSEGGYYVLLFNGIGLLDFNTEFTLSGSSIWDPKASNYNTVLKLAKIGANYYPDGSKEDKLFKSIVDLGKAAIGQDTEYNLTYKAETPASSGQGPEEGAAILFTGKNLLMNDTIALRLYGRADTVEAVEEIKILFNHKYNATRMCDISTPVYDAEKGVYTFTVDVYFSTSTMEEAITITVIDGSGKRCLELNDRIDWIAQTILAKQPGNTLAKQILIYIQSINDFVRKEENVIPPCEPGSETELGGEVEV